MLTENAGLWNEPKGNNHKPPDKHAPQPEELMQRKPYE
ncbi:hypothetical protein MCERE19_01426 [Spirosomataceae bacterium]|jgi:hypothetical protein